MSTYYDISLSHRVFNELLEAIEKAVNYSDEFDDVYELVHLYDFLESEMEESRAKYNKDTQRYLEQQQLFTENRPDNIFQFHKIKAVLNEYDLDLDVEEEFHLICDLSEVIKNGGE